MMERCKCCGAVRKPYEKKCPYCDNYYSLEDYKEEKKEERKTEYKTQDLVNVKYLGFDREAISLDTIHKFEGYITYPIEIKEFDNGNFITEDVNYIKPKKVFFCVRTDDDRLEILMGSLSSMLNHEEFERVRWQILNNGKYI